MNYNFKKERKKMDVAESSDSLFLSREDHSFTVSRRSPKIKQVGCAEGVWSQEEKLRFVSFLIFNKVALSSKLQRRTSKVFKQMALFIRTRTPAQCRSQNQKIYKRFKTISRIVAEFKKEFGESHFQEAYSRLSSDPTIKFMTELNFKVHSREETQHSERAVVEVAIQTQEVPCPSDSMQQLWMQEMFKLSMLNGSFGGYGFPCNPYAHPFSF